MSVALFIQLSLIPLPPLLSALSLSLSYNNCRFIINRLKRRHRSLSMHSRPLFHFSQNCCWPPWPVCSKRINRKFNLNHQEGRERVECNGLLITNAALLALEAIQLAKSNPAAKMHSAGLHQYPPDYVSTGISSIASLLLFLLVSFFFYFILLSFSDCCKVGMSRIRAKARPSSIEGVVEDALYSSMPASSSSSSSSSSAFGVTVRH